MSPTSPLKRLNVGYGTAYEEIFGYSRAVRFGVDVHISATCASPDYADSAADLQADVALRIIEKALSDAGASMHDVVRTVIYLREIKDAEAVARIHLKWFRQILPAATVVQVTSLRRPWQRVAVQAHAKICRPT